MTTSTPDIADALARFGVAPDTSMREVLRRIDANGKGVAVAVDAAGRFLGLVTDGDVRRAILAGLDFEQTVAEFLARKAVPGGHPPLTAPPETSENDLRRMIDASGVRHLPLVDGDGRFVGLALKSDLTRESEPALRAVVMAGGKGVRLRPFVATPKPLVKVGNKPVIERIVDQLKESGVTRINVTTHYKADKIQEHFGDGSRFGVQVGYTYEDEPLGTAGALALVEPSDEPMLVINGDIMTTVDFRAMLAFHREQKSDLTVAVRTYEVSVPFGVVEAEGAKVTRLVEKPSLKFFINAGIYLLEPAVVRRIPQGRKTDMTDLIGQLLETGGNVTSFPIHEYWVDIGQMDDFIRVETDALEGKFDTPRGKS